MRRAALLALATLAFTAGGAAAQSPKLLAPSSQPVAAVSGAWEISLGGGERKCRVQLNAKEIRGRHMLLGAPAACKASIPILTQAAQWGLGEDGAIHLFKPDGGALYLFRRDATGGFKAEGGADLVLEPVGKSAQETPRSESVTATLNALNGTVPAKDADRAALAGSYATGRARDGGACELRLERVPGPRAKSGGPVWTAALDAACRDEGLRVFDPVGWQYENGRIFLLAKRGSSIGFTRDGGAWRKDPESGRPLWMRKK